MTYSIAILAILMSDHNSLTLPEALHKGLPVPFCFFGMIELAFPPHICFHCEMLADGP